MRCTKNKIGEYIEESGYRKNFIAKKLGIGERQLTKYITGESYPSVPRLFQLTKLLDCTAEDLYEFEEGK
ncbi:helix-turn-helix transcriptional regulator [Priestia megaterium]|uniref:helix-turn-helix domain-containing protein n=1 Tax=Priestia megaterium TaxID=1404 RepID=UPI00114EB28E